MIIITMNIQAARAAGYRALTGRFYLPGEQEMLDGVIADMRRGRISHVLVKDRLGVSVWRRGHAGAREGSLLRGAYSEEVRGRGASSPRTCPPMEERVGKKGTQVENLYSRLGGLRYERAAA
jgi:hypothetical protein